MKIRYSMTNGHHFEEHKLESRVSKLKLNRYSLASTNLLEQLPMIVLVEELAPVTYALVCALILTSDLNKVPIGVTKKVGHVIGVMVIFPPSWKMAAIVG